MVIKLIRMDALYRRAVGFCVLIVITSLVLVSAVAQAESLPTINFGTGTKDSVYDVFGQRLIESLLTAKLIAENSKTYSSQGSVENYRKLKTGAYNIAMVQQDVAANFINRDKKRDIQVVCRAFYEFLHILKRKNLNINSPAAFRGLKIFPGNLASGSRFTADFALDVIGISPSQYQLHKKPDGDSVLLDELPQLFRDRRLDIAMTVTVPGDHQLRDGLSQGTHTLYPLSYELLRKLIDQEDEQSENVVTGQALGQVQLAHLPEGAYPGIEGRPSVFTVLALVMTRAEFARAHNKIIQHIIEDAPRIWEKLQEDRGWKNVVPVNLYELSNSGIPMVAEYKGDSDDVRPIAWDFFCALIAWVLLLLVVFYHRTRITRWVRQNEFRSVGVAIVLVLLMTTLFIYFYERNRSEHFSSLTKSFWSIIVYVFSGFEDRAPHTAVGRVLSVIIMAIGPLLIALVTGWLASNFVKKYLEKTVPKDLKNHFVILNWNETGVELIEELTNDELSKSGMGNRDIVVLAEDLSEVEVWLAGKQKQRVHCHQCNPANPNALEELNIAEAQTVVVLSHKAAGERADERTIRVVLALQRLADQLVQKKKLPAGRPHVVAEVRHRANVEVLEHLAAHFKGELEVVAADRSSIRMVAQAALNPGLASVFSDLLSVSESSELYLVQIPDSANGVSFTEYAARIISHGGGGSTILPLGVRRSVNGRHETQCNPQPESSFATLQKGDHVVLMALDKPKSTDLPS